MAACRRVYDSHHVQADCKEPGSVPEPYARQSSIGYLFMLQQLVTKLRLRGERALRIQSGRRFLHPRISTARRAGGLRPAAAALGVTWSVLIRPRSRIACISPTARAAQSRRICTTAIRSIESRLCDSAALNIWWALRTSPCRGPNPAVDRRVRWMRRAPGWQVAPDGQQAKN